MMDMREEYSEITNLWDALIDIYPECADILEFDLMTEQAVIVKSGNQWCIYSESGKRLGCYPTKPQAKKRLKQIEMFKHMKENKGTEEIARQECSCRECLAEFFVRGRCDQSTCPVCGASGEDLDELTGLV